MLHSKLKMGTYRPPNDYSALNYEERSENAIIDTIAIHYTVTDYLRSYQLLTSERRTSAHYLIREDGRIDNLVADEKKAWHAGMSYWNSKTNINDNSIGIELVNSGSGEQACYPTVHDIVDSPLNCTINSFPMLQMQSLVKLIEHLKIQHPNILDCNIVGHSDVAPARKIDPGIAFDWKWLHD